MEYQLNEIKIVYKYHERFGKRKKESFADWLIRKRSINTACFIIIHVSQTEWSEFLSALYFKCDETRYGKLKRLYESQLEEAWLNPDRFVENLDSFFVQMRNLIEQENLYSVFYDFSKIVEWQQEQKTAQGYKDIFVSYYSLLMQQGMYFPHEQIEKTMCGITTNGTPIFGKTAHPYFDMGSIALEKKIYSLVCGNGTLSMKDVHKAFASYGYDINDWGDVQYLEAVAKTHENNTFAMIPYINEYTPNIIIVDEYLHLEPTFPRAWKPTDFYRDKLLHRNYMLPATGVKATYVNAGDIEEIFFQEVFYQNEIVLLYRVTTRFNGQHAGYFHTKSQHFYSVYRNTDRPEWHKQIENFILENYMILTCDYEVDRKKNYAIRQVEQFDREFHYPEQPLVIYSYQNTSGIKKDSAKASHTRNYVKEEYQEEMITRSGYIRRLPIGQHASWEAMQHAAELGLDLPDGRTFVRSHEFMVYRKRIYEEESAHDC